MGKSLAKRSGRLGNDIVGAGSQRQVGKLLRPCLQATERNSSFEPHKQQRIAHDGLLGVLGDISRSEPAMDVLIACQERSIPQCELSHHGE